MFRNEVVTWLHLLGYPIFGYLVRIKEEAHEAHTEPVVLEAPEAQKPGAQDKETPNSYSS